MASIKLCKRHGCEAMHIKLPRVHDLKYNEWYCPDIRVSLEPCTFVDILEEDVDAWRVANGHPKQ